MTRCATHTAYEADYCPICGTTISISERTGPQTRLLVCYKATRAEGALPGAFVLDTKKAQVPAST